MHDAQFPLFNGFTWKSLNPDLFFFHALTSRAVEDNTVINTETHRITTEDRITGKFFFSFYVIQ